MTAQAPLAARVDAIRERIARACERCGRSPADVRLVAVTKTHPVTSIVEAYGAGIRDFGENRVQEAAAKIPVLRVRCAGATWHLIGNLQTNKVRAALRLFDILHSVDSIRLAEAIDARADRRVPVLIEVNVAGEASKHGVSPDVAGPLAEAVGKLANLEPIGLMTVAPVADDPEDVRPVFRRLRELRDALGLRELSMGMTDDFEVAIEEGATIVRIGRAIFGARER